MCLLNTALSFQQIVSRGNLVKTHLHDEFEGIEDDHAGFGREDSLEVGIGLWVGDAGQRPSAAAVACSSAAAADGGIAAQREGVVSGEGGLEERGRCLVPTSPIGVRNWRWRRPI